MSIFKRKIKKATTPGSVGDEGQRSLFLQVSDMGWQMQFISETGGPDGERRRSDCSLMTGEASGRVEAILGQAIKALSRSDRRRLGRIHLMLSDQATVLLDDAGGEFDGASPDALRRIAARQLNCGSASYCVSELKTKDGVKTLYGMADTSILRTLLHQMDDLAPIVAGITPAVALLTGWAARLDRPYCALYLDAYSAKVMVMDLANNLVVVRTLPIGIMSLPAAVAHYTRVNLAKAQEGLQKRDIIATLEIGQKHDEGAQGLSKGPYHDAMAPLLRALKAEVEATLRYATDQRLGQMPDKIEVFGELEKVSGLVNWLNSNLELPVEPAEQDLFELFITADTPPPMNLLTGAEGSLISVGKTKYRFSQEGFVEDKALPAADINIRRASGRRGQGMRDRQRRGGAHRGGRGNSDQGGLFGLSLFQSRDGKQSQGGRADPQRLYYLMLSVLFFGLLYWVYISYYEGALGKYRGARIAYEQALLANDTAWRQLKEHRSKSRDPALRARRDDDKVLWSEKMLSIARHMDDKMWITDVYLVNETATYNSQSVSARKLTIEGAVLPSTNGHILEIARYISLLTEDQLFMRDFDRVTFEGAAIDTQETAHVVRFALDAWYDETKVVAGTENGTKRGPTGGLIKKVDRRTEQLEQVRDGAKR